MEWFYVTDAKERLPFDDGEESELVSGGLLRPETMVWHEGMEAWQAASEVRPEWFRNGSWNAPAGGEEPLVREVGRALSGQRGWWVVAGVALVAWGALIVVSTAWSAWRQDLLRLVLELVLLPHGVSCVLGGIGVMRGLFGVARAAELGQRSRLVEAAGRVARAGRTLGIGLLVTLVFAVVAFLLGCVFYWEVVETALGWEAA